MLIFQLLKCQHHRRLSRSYVMWQCVTIVITDLPSSLHTVVRQSRSCYFTIQHICCGWLNFSGKHSVTQTVGDRAWESTLWLESNKCIKFITSPNTVVQLKCKVTAWNWLALSTYYKRSQESSLMRRKKVGTIQPLTCSVGCPINTLLGLLIPVRC